MLLALVSIAFAQAPTPDTDEQLDKLSKILEAIESAHPEAAAEARHDRCEKMCQATLAKATQPLDLDFEENMTACVKSADWHAVDVTDTTALIAHTRKKYPDEMAMRDDNFWREKFVVATEMFASLPPPQAFQ